MTGSCTQNIHLVDNGAGQKQDERRLFRRRARDLVRGKDHPFGAATHSWSPFTSRGSRTGSRRRGQQAEVGAVQLVTGVGKDLLGELVHHLEKEAGHDDCRTSEAPSEPVNSLSVQTAAPVSSAEPFDLCQCSCQPSEWFFFWCQTRILCH